MSKNNADDAEVSAYKDSSVYLTRLYVLALSCIALLAIIGQVLIQYVLHKQQKDSYIINVAGRQRMLSQKICKLSLLIGYAEQNTEAENHIEELNKTLSTWKTFHKGLSEGDAQLGLNQKNSKKVHELFLSVDPYFQKIVRNAEKIIVNEKTQSRESIDVYVKVILQNENDFLKGMDHIVIQYQAEATEKVSLVKRLELVLLSLALLVLLLEGLFIFRPSARKIKSAIDQLRQMQEKLKRTNMELEERVRKRTEEVNRKNRELILRNEELYRKNTDLDTFVYTASHDLKAPIYNIEGLFDQLSSDIPESEKKIVTDMIRESIGKFKNVIKDLAETGKEQVTAENTKAEFKEIFNEIKFSIKDLIKNSEAVIHEDFSDAPEINFSKKHIRSILYNLISNAIKYCPADRKPEIKVLTKNLEDYVLLEVSDNGVGIKEEDKQRVFSLYQRLDTNLKGSNLPVEGTGVGMAIVAKIVDSNGGKIEIDSTPGEGSTFRVYLKRMPPLAL
jgi:signal transduction histidine kinase